MVKVNKKFWKIFLKHFCFFVLFALLFRAKINGNFCFFPLGFYVCLIWCNQNPFLLFADLVLASFLSGLSILTIGIYAGVACVFCLIYFVHLKVKRRLSVLLLNIYLLASLCAFYLLILPGSYNFLKITISIALTMIFFNTNVVFLQPLFLRKNHLKLNVDETICFFVFLMLIASGLSSLKIYFVNFGCLVCYFLVLFATFVFKSEKSIVLSASLGFGFLIAGEKGQFLALILAFGLLLFAFCNVGKIYACIVGILINAGLVYFFDFGMQNKLCLVLFPLLASAAVLLIKDCVFENLHEKFCQSQNSKNKEFGQYFKKSMQDKLFDASNVFDFLSKMFLENAKQTVNFDVAKNVLKEQCENQICKKCDKYQKCFNNDIACATEKLFENAFNKGKTSILDVPPFMVARCNKIDQVIDFVNENSKKCEQFNFDVKEENAISNIVAFQMQSLSDVIKKLGQECLTKKVFDTTLAQKIEEGFVYANLPIEEVVCQQEKNGNIVFLTFKNQKPISKSHVESVVSSLIKTKMEVVQSDEIEVSNQTKFVLKTSPNFDIVFGLASEAKTGSSFNGDSHSFVKLDEGKFLFLVCDGMGSGERANELSEKVCNIAEVFFKAGFDTNLVLQSINRLLLLNSQDDFSALDLCLVDLFEQNIKFFKLASPESLIKTKDGIDVVAVSTLPIGIVEDFETEVVTKNFDGGQFVFLFSDGVRDAFEDLNELLLLIDQIKSVNPQEIADVVMQQVKKKKGGVLLDDATILVFRIFCKV